MDFASEYVYDNCEVSEADLIEYVSDEEYEGGMNISDSSSDSEDDLGEILLAKGGVVSDSSKPVVGLSDIPAAPPIPPRPPQHKAVRHGKKKPHWKAARANSGDGDDLGYFVPKLPERPSRSPKKFRRADTNIVCIKLQKLVAPSNMHAGDPIHCSKCNAVLSKISKIVKDGPDKTWQCEFCEERNLVDIEDEEIPKNDDVTYLLEPALATAASGASGRDESLVVFCVDISGSMCVTTEVPGKVKLRGSSRLERLRSFNDDHSDQYLPRQHRNTTYVSRLQAVQAAVDHQLEEMSREHPHRRVALITFDNEVTVIGDGTATPTAIAGDKLANQEALSKVAETVEMPKSIKETRKSLGDKLFNLEEGGGTALGPSLIVAIEIASKHPGSKIIVCTDGLANVGLGRLDEFKSEQQQEEQESFYETVGNLAVGKGICMSVITIKGTNCKLFHLGKLAEKTGGQVNIVDPMKLTEEFSNILAGQIVATNVVATFILHKQLYFINKKNPETRESKVIREVGNCTTDTEITFEYAMKRPDGKKKPSQSPIPEEMGTDKSAQTKTDSTATDAEPENTENPTAGSSSAEVSAMEGSSTEGAGTAQTTSDHNSAEQRERSPESRTPSELPFQLQVCYTDTDGTKALRVLTQLKPVTQDRNVAEQNVNLDVLGLHTAQHSAQLALDGEYTMSRGHALMNHRLAWRAVQSSPQKKSWYKKIFSKIQTVENAVGNAQQSERSKSGRGTTYSDDEDDEREMEVSDMSKKKKGKLKARSEDVTDTMACNLYECTRISSDSLKK
ncbi:uncharacterized protein LOC121370501 [Gigantopelta aegis]|uniref:uncharacterized protein LOC121370501 n=1 Tax=Gigantopelta aegis TaxID=1735272 RepID=UPI001B88B5EA|nr:uncharacterized protein LOC121370501 [Gigantopelta aegis]